MSRLFILGILIAGLVALAPTMLLSQNPSYNPIRDWGIEPAFIITVDSEGFTLPTAIAVVPQPGDGPRDPLYFVTELGGKVKVVTNDRSVFTFAENFFELKPKAKLPSSGGEVGLAGICLDPASGYIFVTFSYDDTNGFLRNNVVRFQTTPRSFSIEPDEQISFTEVFSGDESSPSHQIGPCQVDGEFLFVSVGDGNKPAFSQVIDSTLGKIVRMTLDGDPVTDNPFYEIDNKTSTANYVWARGFRNPFGLKTLDGRVFAADNGPNLDRFLEVHAGKNYLWDGSDISIGANAVMVLTPSMGVVQMDRYPDGSSLFPEQYRQSFFLTRSGNLPWTTQPETRLPPDIMTIEFTLEGNEIVTTPKPFLRYQGTQNQMLVGLGFGPDGLFFAPLYPDERGINAVYRVTHQPGQLNDLQQNALDIMGQRGCFACHSLNGTGGFLGPPLDRERLIARIKTRLHSPQYSQNVEQIDQLGHEPFTSFKHARKEVLNSSGLDQIRTWIAYQIQEPRFDDTSAVMPNLGVTQQEAMLIADFLMTPEPEDFIQKWVEIGGEFLPRPRKRNLIIFFVGGFILGGLVSGIFQRVLRPTR